MCPLLIPKTRKSGGVPYRVTVDAIVFTYEKVRMNEAANGNNGGNARGKGRALSKYKDLF